MGNVVAGGCDGRSHLCAGCDPLGDRSASALEPQQSLRGRSAPPFTGRARRSHLRRLVPHQCEKLSDRIHLWPIVIWMAFRMSQRETATGIFIVSAIAIWCTLQNFGPFAMETQNQSLLILQIATAVLTLTAMALAAGMAERRRAETALERQKSL